MLKLDMNTVNVEDLFNIELDNTTPSTPTPDICPKCNGSGNFIGYTGRVVGPCFACKGKGVKEIKPVDAGVSIDVSKIVVAITTAFNNGFERPKLKLGMITFSRAPDAGRNAGSVYVKKGKIYLGKVTDGKFHPRSICDDATTKEVVDVAGKMKGSHHEHDEH